jgi:predicted CxxxxCH...CXXCH cytochrome family protein
MGRAQMDKRMGKRVKIKDMANGGDVMDRDRRTCGTKLGLMVLMALVLMAMIAYPSNAWADKQYLYPSGAGSNSTLGFINGSADYTNWQTSDGDTTFSQATAAAQKTTVNVDNPSASSGAINFVKVYAECRMSAGTANEEISICVRDGNPSENCSTDIGIIPAYGLYSNQWDVRPFDSTAWQWSDITALEIGLESKAQGGWCSGCRENCTYVYAEVDYTPYIDDIVVSSNIQNATTATGGQKGVLMQRLDMDCTTGSSGNGMCEMTSITINDMATATSGDWSNMYIHMDNDTNFSNGTFGSIPNADWNGASTNVDLTTGGVLTQAERTVYDGTTKYVWVVYDLNLSAGGRAVQSRVTDIYVAGTDNGTANAWGSNSFPVVVARDALSAGTNTPDASTAEEEETGVEMQSLQVLCSTVQNGQCEVTSVTVDDLGTAREGDWTKMYVHMDDDANFINGTLGSVATSNSWDGKSTVVDLTTGGLTQSERTVYDGTPKYIWVVYDLASDSGDETIQSSITDVGVASPDSGFEGIWNSTDPPFSIVDIDDQLRMSAGTPVAMIVNAGDTGVQMLNVSVDCNNEADGQATMTTVTVDDSGTAGAGDWTKMYVHVDNDQDFSNGTFGSITVSGWDGTSNNVDLTTGGVLTATERTVYNGTTKYIWVIYDMASGSIGDTIRTIVKNIAVSGTDNAATEQRLSNPLTILEDTDIDTISSCSGCHNMPIYDGARSASSIQGASRAMGNHTSVTAHVPPSPTGANCVPCHGTEVTSTNHRNGIINMAGTINSGSYEYGTSFVQNSNAGTRGTCQNTYCHGIDSDPWGTDLSGYYTCTKCHGTLKAIGTTLETWMIAPGNGTGTDTAGDTQTTDPQVGQHFEHLKVPLNTTGGIAASCVTCHLEPTNVFDTGHIDNGAPAEMTFNDFVKNFGMLTPGRTGNTCENTYCHGNAMPAGSDDGNGQSPGWLQASYMTGSADNDCAKCHGFPPKGYDGEHEGMTDFAADESACHICHQILKDPLDDNESGWAGGAFNDKNKHIDGNLDVAAACDGCHGYPPVKGDDFAYLDVQGKGVHASHVVHLEKLYGLTRDAGSDTFDDSKVEILCMACHFGSQHEQTQQDTQNEFRTIDFDQSIYKFGTSNAAYNGFQNVPGATTAKTCSNNSCHYIISPQWEQWP